MNRQILINRQMRGWFPKDMSLHNTRVSETSKHCLQICHVNPCSFHCKIVSTFWDRCHTGSWYSFSPWLQHDSSCFFRNSFSLEAIPDTRHAISCIFFHNGFFSGNGAILTGSPASAVVLTVESTWTSTWNFRSSLPSLLADFPAIPPSGFLLGHEPGFSSQKLWGGPALLTLALPVVLLEFFWFLLFSTGESLANFHSRLVSSAATSTRSTFRCENRRISQQ